MSIYRNIFIFIFFAPIVSRYITWNFYLGLKGYDLNTYLKYIYRPFHTNCEGLIGGMIISNYYYDKKSFFYNRLKKILPLIFIGGITFFASFYSKIYFNFSGVALGFSALLTYSLKSNGKIVNLLSKDILYVISKTSFAIYLIHVHVINNLISQRLIKSLSLGIGSLEILIAFMFVMVISILISIVLYILVEKPFMILRDKVLIHEFHSKG